MNMIITRYTTLKFIFKTSHALGYILKLANKKERVPSYTQIFSKNHESIYNTSILSSYYTQRESKTMFMRQLSPYSKMGLAEIRMRI